MLPRITHLPIPDDWEKLIRGFESPLWNNFSCDINLWGDQLISLIQNIEFHIQYAEQSYLEKACMEKIVGITNRQPFERLYLFYI